jgi:hypothetical protein
MEPAINAHPTPFPPQRIGHGPPRSTSRKSFFQALGRAKCADQFGSGDWEGLLDDHYEAEELLAERFKKGERGATQLADGPTDEEAQARRIRRSPRLGRAGELSRAARALELSRSAPVTEETIQTLRELHPAAPFPIPDWVATFEPVDTCLLSPETLHAALTSAPSLSAGGPSG